MPSGKRLGKPVCRRSPLVLTSSAKPVPDFAGDCVALLGLACGAHARLRRPGPATIFCFAIGCLPSLVRRSFSRVRWYTPSFTSLTKPGIQPHVCAKMAIAYRLIAMQIPVSGHHFFAQGQKNMKPVKASLHALRQTASSPPPERLLPLLKPPP